MIQRAATGKREKKDAQGCKHNGRTKHGAMLAVVDGLEIKNAKCAVESIAHPARMPP